MILGVDGKRFDSDARIAFAKALTAAEAGDGKLKLIRWRSGNQENVVVEIEVLGAYSATAPYDCPKSALIFQRGCEALAERMRRDDYKMGAIARSWNAMALLASGDEKYRSLIRREAEWAAAFHADGMATWWNGYVMMFLAEYVMQTGDTSVMAGLERLVGQAVMGQSMVGSWGHGYALPDGRLGGYGMMNAPGVPLTTGLVMARAAGAKHPKLDVAIERSAKLLRFYIGKGAVPYGDHAPWYQTHEDNGKCGMAAVLFNYLDEPEGAKYFAKMSLAAHGHEREYGHTGNYWNISWAMPGLSQLGPQASGAWMKEFGHWYYDMARRWDYRFPHQGPAEPGRDKTANWDATGFYLMAYAMPHKKLWLTGKRESKIEPLTAEQAQEVIAAGRGWTRHDRTSGYDGLPMEVLFGALESWSPVVRLRAAEAIKRRGGEPPVPALMKLLENGTLHARLGACQALEELGMQAVEAAPVLVKTLEADDLWLRVKAAQALGKMGDAGRDALPLLLEKIAAGPSVDDPRAMEQRFLAEVVFGGLLKGPIAEADFELVAKAVKAGLQNEDGRTRGTVGKVYQLLSDEQAKALMPAIREAVAVRAPSGIMFGDGVRIEGLRVMAEYKVDEGLDLCMAAMEIERWGKSNRLKNLLEIIDSYGPAAKRIVPELKQLIADLKVHREAKMLAVHVAKAEAIVAKLGG